ncbi:MAG: nSTAND1 domain-containing NTPase [Pseudonocardiales bacterium]
MARVFISYARDDLAQAREIYHWLGKAGHNVFLDKDPHDGIAIGEPWRQRLRERLRWADAVVCVVTPAYLASTWCTAEVATAQERGSRLLPLRVGPDADHPLLTDVQHTDLARDPAAARAALIAVLRRIDAAGGLGWPDDRSPFPGLRPFDVNWHRVFFGRTDEIKALTELVRAATEGIALLVAGPSGCGKSSLVRAGLLPVMANEPGWRTVPPFLPGGDPVAALARQLTTAARAIGLDWKVDQVEQRLDTNGLGYLADELLQADPGGPQQRLLIVVDQFEELLTQAAPGQRDRFITLLRRAKTSPVQVVGTLRPEFLDQLLADPGLAALPTGISPLRPLRREALRLVIEGPARLAGIDVEASLVARLVDDTDTGEALPLLAFTLAQLADGVGRGGQLSAARYDQLGGVRGALARQAEAALAEAITVGGRHREQVIAGLLRLVTIDEEGRPIRWRINRAVLPEQVTTELDAFVTRRLLTTDTGNDAAVIGAAHEAFLSAWPPLAEAIATNGSALRARRAVEHAATEWHDQGRPLTRLWSGGQLAGTVTDTGAHLRVGTPPERPSPSRQLLRRPRMLVTNPVELSPTARDFLHASIRHDCYRRRRATTVLSVLLVLALIGAGVAVVQQHRAQEQQRIATARQLVAQADTLLESDPRTALRLGVAAERIYPGDETRGSLLGLLSTTQYAGALTAHTRPVSAVAFAPDRDQPILATAGADSSVILWDITDPAQPRQVGQPLTAHTGPVFAVAFAPDGHTLATAGDDHSVILWKLTNPVQPRQLHDLQDIHDGGVSSVAWAPDRPLLATAGNDTVTASTVILWDITDPAYPRRIGRPLEADVGRVSSMVFARNGDILAIVSEGGSVILWDLTDLAQGPQPSGPAETGSGRVFSAAFAPGGRVLATADVDGSVILWNFADPTRHEQFDSPLYTGKASSAVAFSADARTLATAHADGSVSLWDLTDLTRPQEPFSFQTDHTGRVSSVVFASHGRILATAGADGSVILWSLTNPAQPQQLSPPLAAHTGTVLSMAFDSAGRTLATASDDRLVTLWDLTNPAQPQQLSPPLIAHTGRVNSVAFASGRPVLATASDDGSVILWDLAKLNNLQNHAAGRACAIAGSGLAPDEWSQYIRWLPYQDTCPG